MELMDDLLGDVLGGAHFRVQQDVSLAVKGVAVGEEFADFGQWIGVVEQGAMGLVFYAVPDFFWRGPEIDGEGMGFDAGEIFRVGGEAATGGYDGLFAGGQFGNDFFLEGAEGRFTIFGKNFTNGFAGAGFDDLISVEEGEVQLGGDELADRRFAGPHETDERDVVNLPHPNELTDLCVVGTQFLKNPHPSLSHPMGEGELFTIWELN